MERLTPEVYRKFVQDCDEYPRELVDTMEDTARFLASGAAYSFIFNSIYSVVKKECLSMGYEHSGDLNNATLARSSAINEQREISGVLSGDERLQKWYTVVEGRVAGLLALSREVLPDRFDKVAPHLLGRVKEWAEILYS